MSFGWRMLTFVVLDLVFSIPSHNYLCCVEWDVKPHLSQLLKPVCAVDLGQLGPCRQRLFHGLRYRACEPWSVWRTPGDRRHSHTILPHRLPGLCTTNRHDSVWRRSVVNTHSTEDRGLSGPMSAWALYDERTWLRWRWLVHIHSTGDRGLSRPMSTWALDMTQSDWGE